MKKNGLAVKGFGRCLGRWGTTAVATMWLVACGGGGDSGGSAAVSDKAGDAQLIDNADEEAFPFSDKLSAMGSSMRCLLRVNNTFDKLLDCVTLAGVKGHLSALQSIADAHNGNRASGTPGYDDSAAYAAAVLRRAGYQVTVQSFQFKTFLSLSPSLLQQVAPAPTATLANVILAYSGSQDATAPVSLLPAPPTDPTPGCEAADFAGFTPGHIALISRGNCTFALKATNAFNAGAVGVVIYNNVAGDISFTPSLGEDFSLNIGVTMVTQALGQQLVATPGLVLRLKTDTFRGVATSNNVIAESRTGDPGNVVMVGAHLDSVDQGPGINDNGSGAAAVLETAVQMARVRPRNKLRFALWGAEEEGLLGSIHYVDSLTPAEKERIALYLNFDMIGSPNPVYFIYDGDDSDATGEGPGPGGSAQIEKVFEAFYTRRGLPFKGTDFDGRSDYWAFIQNNIPAGGLFTGAEGIKTAEEAAIWGGTAGQPYDPCYHQACDNYTNVSNRALDVNADAVAYATLLFSMDTSSVNGWRGKSSSFRMPPFKSPQKPRVAF